MTPCLFCQHSNPDGARFCNDCGTPLDMRPCTACNAVDKRTATHCYQCGAPFAEPDPGAPHAAPKLTVPKFPAPKVAAPRVAAPPPPVDFKFSPPFTKWGAADSHAGDTLAPVAVAEADPPREARARPDPGVVPSAMSPPADGPDLPRATVEMPAPSTPSDPNEALPPLIVTPPPREEDEGVRAPRPTRPRSRQRWVAVAALVALAALAFIVDRERLRDPAPATTVVTTSPVPASPSGRETSAPIREEAPASPPGPPATPAGGCAPGVAALGLCDIGRTRGGR